ncbi:uncharacterized protein LOC134275342 [Saccostrea cucullata]|uniref:uncharacterized protein LOC134275342 n=1 Tax=Saccostrea cuccullata TaxID=36930 RepID=UPI002ED2ABEC
MIIQLWPTLSLSEPFKSRRHKGKSKMTDAFADSQETIPESIAAGHESQDLFNENNENPGSKNDEIIRKLDKLAGEISLLRKEIRELKEKQPTTDLITSPKFTMDTAKCKRRYTLYLRSRFSCRPWLDVKNDDFRNEIHTCLAMDGMRTNPAAMQEMVSFGLSKFTELRNQFRRKILADKAIIPAKPLGELCVYLFQNYCKADECILSVERMHASLVLRHFLHKKKYFNTGESTAFWADFKAFLEEIEKDERPQKWERLEDIDRRRTERVRDNTEE